MICFAVIGLLIPAMTLRAAADEDPEGTLARFREAKNRLFAEHPEIYYLGRFDGPAYKARYGKFDSCRDATVQTVMNEIAYSAQTDPDLPRCQGLLEQAARHCDAVEPG